MNQQERRMIQREAVVTAARQFQKIENCMNGQDSEENLSGSEAHQLRILREKGVESLLMEISYSVWEYEGK